MKMDLTINIKNVDDEAKLDIEYIINKYLRRVKGLYDTGLGKCGHGEYYREEINFIVKRNFENLKNINGGNTL